MKRRDFLGQRIKVMESISSLIDAQRQALYEEAKSLEAFFQAQREMAKAVLPSGSRDERRERYEPVFFAVSQVREGGPVLLEWRKSVNNGKAMKRLGKPRNKVGYDVPKLQRSVRKWMADVVAVTELYAAILRAELKVLSGLSRAVSGNLGQSTARVTHSSIAMLEGFTRNIGFNPADPKWRATSITDEVLHAGQ